MVYESSPGRNASRNDWRRVPDDPDLERDLDYELDDWEVVRTRDSGPDRLMFLPADEEMLRDEAFVLADDDAVCNLEHQL
ncbi:hypothetical protein [Halomicrococcus sp. SG-WS-1]|uniref:hypothetical protein n=1 Tax=Halomicrococcus sp. SG-WS-1 TaxID=3439057 RepID=UPI003F79ADBE